MRKGKQWTFVESSEFQQASTAHLSDAELDALKELIPRHPDKWIELKEAPGLFALHWGIKAPVTIVFAIAPVARKVYLLGVEVGRRYSVTEEVKRQLPALLKKLEKLGTRVFAGFGVRELIRWIIEHWPF
jgi:hypothetical protein